VRIAFQVRNVDATKIKYESIGFGHDSFKSH